MKRGQATSFVVVGLVILAAVILIFWLRGQFYFGPFAPKSLEERFDAISQHIISCIEQVSPDYIERIGLQGGHLKTPEDTYRLDKGIPVSYLCYNIPDSPQCYNRMLTRQDMQSELNDAIRQSLSTCLRLGSFRRGGVEMTVGNYDVATDIGDDNVIVTVNMPVTLRRDSEVISEDTFAKSFDYPLGRLYDVSQDIIDVEAQFGEFEQLSYMLAHKGQYVIDKKKPYPDKLYILNTKDSDYIFQFFVQDEPSS